jgi:hypothetical protein
MTEQQILAEVDGLQRLGRLIDRALWVVVFGAMAYASVGVTLFANRHGVPLWAGWALDPLVSIALVAVLQARSVLARYGVELDSGWVTAVEVWAGAATLTMNVWQSAVSRDPAGVVVHTVLPTLMILLAIASPWIRRKITEAVKVRRAAVERETAAREAAATAFRAERERERAERDKPAETPVPRARRQVSAAEQPERRDTLSADASTPTAEEIIRAAWQADLAAGNKIVAAEYDRLAGTNNYARGLIRKWTAEQGAEAVA